MTQSCSSTVWCWARAHLLLRDQEKVVDLDALHQLCIGPTEGLKHRCDRLEGQPAVGRRAVPNLVPPAATRTCGAERAERCVGHDSGLQRQSKACCSGFRFKGTRRTTGGVAKAQQTGPASYVTPPETHLVTCSVQRLASISGAVTAIGKLSSCATWAACWESDVGCRERSRLCGLILLVTRRSGAAKVRQDCCQIASDTLHAHSPGFCGQAGKQEVRKPDRVQTPTTAPSAAMHWQASRPISQSASAYT